MSSPLKRMKGKRQEQPLQAMFACNGLIFIVSSLILLLTLDARSLFLVECQEQLTVESRQQKDNNDLADTIQYLENLDKYFSQIARPRFGRSESPRRLLTAAVAQPSSSSSARLQGAILDGRQQDNLSRYELPMMDILAAHLAAAHKYSRDNSASY